MLKGADRGKGSRISRQRGGGKVSEVSKKNEGGRSCVQEGKKRRRTAYRGNKPRTKPHKEESSFLTCPQPREQGGKKKKTKKRAPQRFEREGKKDNEERPAIRTIFKERDEISQRRRFAGKQMQGRGITLDDSMRQETRYLTKIIKRRSCQARAWM